MRGQCAPCAQAGTGWEQTLQGGYVGLESMTAWRSVAVKRRLFTREKGPTEGSVMYHQITCTKPQRRPRRERQCWARRCNKTTTAAAHLHP